ncbi:hypothetical protein HAV22_24690 [Massilia sp. TW-1]|uniref:YCII-related domain-containing protein n=1 Tax=Telluria antibiotica TaxID=2717319 RepID=A0ABX0PHB9_9BURK|nr:YciI family protein [Telluria antibiotica]NIA56825.1 hypothetical protein [Telluria antibiotica]
MYVVLLKFAENKSKASDFMHDHNAWIKRGLDDGVFLVVGSLQPNLGGAIVAHGESLADLQARVDADPFVAHGIVQAEVLEIKPGKVDPRLEFLLA